MESIGLVCGVHLETENKIESVCGFCGCGCSVFDAGWSTKGVVFFFTVSSW